MNSSRSTVRAGQASREGSSDSQLTALGARLGVCLILKVLGTFEGGRVKLLGAGWVCLLLQPQCLEWTRDILGAP